MNSTDPEIIEFTPESSPEPLTLDRLIYVSQNMAHRAINYPGELFQTVTSFPYPKDDSNIINEHLRKSTFRQAQRDNRMIDQYTRQITQCEEKMQENQENGELGILSQFSVDSANSQIYSHTQVLRDDMYLLKTSRRITSDDIENRNRGDGKKWHQTTNGRLF